MKSFIFASTLAFLTILAPTTKAAAAEDTTLEFAGGNVQAKAHWEQGPVDGSESILDIQFVDAKTQEPVALGTSTLKVAVFMAMMGHGSSPTTVTQVADGSYRVSKIYFTMGGEWEVRVTVKHTDGSSEMQAFKVNL